MESYMIKKSLHSEDLYNRRKLIKSEIWWETRGEQKNNVKISESPIFVIKKKNFAVTQLQLYR